jgi:hypothetical protein
MAGAGVGVRMAARAITAGGDPAATVADVSVGCVEGVLREPRA